MISMSVVCTVRPMKRAYEWRVNVTQMRNPDGGLYRIYRDRAAEKWFADGVYD